VKGYCVVEIRSECQREWLGSIPFGHALHRVQGWQECRVGKPWLELQFLCHVSWSDERLI
jgi:hypothetical protein